MRTSSWAFGFAMAVAAAAVPALARAQPSYALVRSFVLPPAVPLYLVELEPGVFAAATQRGGSSDRGTIVRFARRPDGSFSTTVLHSFASATGTPSSLVRGADGALYGTTDQYGGSTDVNPTAFRVTPSGVFTTLHVFTPFEGLPQLALRLGNGDFYGTVTTGIFGVAPLFRMTPDGTVTDLSFIPPPNFPPLVRLAQAPDGNVFGFVNGSFVRIVSDSEVTVLRELPSNITEGSSLVASSDGNFYATTRDNGPSGPAAVVRMTPTGALSTLHVFPAGSGAHTLMEASDGHLYGLSNEASVGRAVPVVFQLTKTGRYTVLHRFSFWDGEGGGSLIQSAGGSLFGTQASGGTSLRGVFYEISATGFAVRSHFSDPTPLRPSGPLVRGPDGALYGTSCEGGDYNVGTVFRITEAGALTVLHSFRYWDGVYPCSSVVLGNDGSFYGTAGLSLIGQGSIFKITPAGVFSLLHIFAAGSGRGPAGLLLASDGNFYGTTTAPDGLVHGAVFRITPAGTFSVLHAFDGGPVRRPVAGLAQGVDGALYGTTFYPVDSPGAFRLTLAGAYQQWQPFGSLWFPRRLIRAADGHFYGTIANEVFRMTVAGDVTLVSALAPGVAPYPIADLLQGSDGALYGTTWGGGAANFGTVFRVTPEGAYDTLHSFTQTDGEKSLSTLAETTPGTFYGTTTSGGPGQGGVIFRLVKNPPPF